jgi:hypothetical protein
MDESAVGSLSTCTRNTVGGGEDGVSGSEDKKEGGGMTMKIPFLWGTIQQKDEGGLVGGSPLQTPHGHFRMQGTLRTSKLFRVELRS